MTDPIERCHIIDIDGEPVSVHSASEPNRQDIEHLTAIVRAVKGHVDKTQPHYGVIQELLAAVRLATYCIPDGPVHASIAGERDGAEVKSRLKRAALAAWFALDPTYEAVVAARAKRAANDDPEWTPSDPEVVSGD